MVELSKRVEAYIENVEQALERVKGRVTGRAARVVELV